MTGVYEKNNGDGMALPENTNGQRKIQILILGGGFGGLYAALELEKRLGKRSDMDITLINKENYILFTPMLHEVAASDLDITHIVNPTRKLLKHIRFFHGEVESIDLERRKVVACHGEENHEHELEYDYLLIALGSETSFHDLPGREDTVTMKSLGDAIHLRNRVIDSLEAADFECFPDVREPLLTVVVAGGGFAGVETIASVNDFMRDALKFYPHITENMLRLVLVHSGKTILPELGEKLGAYAQRKLAERKVEIMTNVRVKSFINSTVELNNGTIIKADTLVWTAGTSPCPLLATLPCEKERGRVAVNEFMEVSGYPGVWALGDCALIPDPATGNPYPPTAQHAVRQGKVAGRNMAAAILGTRKQPFVFKTIGALATIGRRTGVARIFGFNFSGFIAWWMWRTVYLSKLPRLEKKIRVAFDWTLDLLFSKDLVKFETRRARAISTPHEDDYGIFRGKHRELSSTRAPL
jgi:NADH dehydrogenase